MVQYGVSRGTIRKAIQSLVKEGLMLTVRVEQRRSFLTPFVMRQGMYYLQPHSEYGAEYRTEVLFKQVVPADQAVAEHLEILLALGVLLRRVGSVADRRW